LAGRQRGDLEQPFERILAAEFGWIEHVRRHVRRRAFRRIVLLLLLLLLLLGLEWCCCCCCLSCLFQLQCFAQIIGAQLVGYQQHRSTTTTAANKQTTTTNTQFDAE
jgi:hypothetical protein